MLTFDQLMDYTEWERAQWRAWFAQSGDSVLLLTAGPNGDGRFSTVGDLIRHILTAEKRYVERLRGLPLTEASSVPNDDSELLFAFGERSRAELREFAASCADWDTPRQLKILTFEVTATPRKFIAHTLLHEVRHWAQIATLLRLSGHKCEFHDFLVSPVMGGAFRAEQ